MRSMTALSERSRGKKRFGAYCAYGFGVHLAVVGASWVVEKCFAHTGLIVPAYGQHNCNFSVDPHFYYMTLVTSVLFLINIGLASLVVRFFWSSLQGTRQVEHSSTKKHKSQAILIGKLVLLTGVPWAGEFIGAFIPGQVTWFALAWTFLLGIEGVAIFWIFVLQKKILKELCDKYTFFNGIRKAFNGSERAGSSSSITGVKQSNSASSA